MARIHPPRAIRPSEAGDGAAEFCPRRMPMNCVVNRASPSGCTLIWTHRFRRTARRRAARRWKRKSRPGGALRSATRASAGWPALVPSRARAWLRCDRSTGMRVVVGQTIERWAFELRQPDRVGDVPQPLDAGVLGVSQLANVRVAVVDLEKSAPRSRRPDRRQSPLV